jgi:hypothetical protein
MEAKGSRGNREAAEATARHERRLEADGCMPLLGGHCSGTLDIRHEERWQPA